MILHGGERRDRLGALRLITVSDQIGRNYRIGPYFSIFVFVLSSFFFFSSFFLLFFLCIYYNVLEESGSFWSYSCSVRSVRFQRWVVSAQI